MHGKDICKFVFSGKTVCDWLEQFFKPLSFLLGSRMEKKKANQGDLKGKAYLKVGISYILVD